MEEDELTQLNNQQENSRADHLKPWQFKPGQSGNPNGRPKGRSMKEFAKEYLSSLTEEERIKYFEGMDKIDVWKMAEGNPESKTDLTTAGMPIIQVAPEIAIKNELNTSPEGNS